jgi:uncharacterized membrane protein YfcA
VSPIEFLVASGAVTIGAMLQGTVGFGLGLVAAPILVLIDTSLVPGPLLFCGLMLTMLLTGREFRSVDMGGLTWALIGRLPGVVLGAAAIALIARDHLALLFGVLILTVSAISSLGPRLPVTRRTLMSAGALSGFMATTISVGGPPMGLLYQHDAGSKIRGTLSGYFVAGAAMSLAALAVVGRFGWTEITLAGSLLPGVVLGFILSRKSAERLDEGKTRLAVLTVSIVTGVVVLVRALN